jgi:cobyrinic acid a,c-diamide synthase
MRRIMIAGTKSGVGKTTVSSAIMAALKNVAPFKVGPDYIDPRFHEYVTGNSSYNLDAFMLTEETLKYLFWTASFGKNISVVEGVMGLYDGLGNGRKNFSSAHVAKILDIPVILVVDAKGVSTSIAAEVLGYNHFDKEVDICGVILNNVSSEKMYLSLKEAVESYAGVECVGYFPKNEKISLESRHLGLKQAAELEDMGEKVQMLKKLAEKYIDLERIKELAEKNWDTKNFNPGEKLKGSLAGLNVAVAKDRAFSFYYNANLDLLKYAGAKLMEFSPVIDAEIPEGAEFIYLGGGYPENYAKELAANTSMIASVKEACKRGVPVYAECGGFIYLTNGIKLLEDEFYEFCGVLDMKIEMKNRLNMNRFGYVDIETADGIMLRGHEFHYSDIYENNEQAYYFKVRKRDGRTWNCGLVKNNVIAGYPHINFYSNLEFFERIFSKTKKIKHILD